MNDLLKLIIIIINTAKQILILSRCTLRLNDTGTAKSF